MPGDRLLGPGSPIRKPLIPSGPSAAPASKIGRGDPSAPRKSPFGKRELTKYRKLLLAKRSELLGDMEQIETDALRGESGDLSHFPQHMADQGSDSFERSLSLDLAAADRRLIKEIDDALRRIDDGTFGLCLMTGKPIAMARLNELPWARHSIEAAREIERRGGA
ncbi:MAG: TraR/DksA family transcriptional regulator [Phycisphaeraceae bacterium]|nr:MAG: TraR/DksA family transcriptional regulator [Phycisphaeraceae bacterium]